MTYLILDLIIVAVLVIFAVHGAWRGLVLSLCGLVAVVIAFAGAGFAARALSPAVAEALEPRFAAAIEARLDAGLQSAVPFPDEAPNGGTDENPLQSVLDILKDMGFYESLIDDVNKAVEEGMSTAASAAAQSVAYLVIFLIAFFVILLVWRLISRALDLVARLPGLHFLNKTGGALFGLLKACILLFVAAWLLQFLGGLIPEETVTRTHLLKFFMKTNPFALISRFSIK